jgi:hypothetical protein
MRALSLARPRWFVMAAGVVGMFAVAGGMAYATIPDASGVIHGCYTKPSTSGTPGALRVIDTGQHCLATEVAISWSQTGPAGAVGPAGPAGPKGDKGYTGAAGARGPSDDWFSSSLGLLVVPTDSWTPLLSLNVPAGNFFVSAMSVFSAPAESHTFCDIYASGIEWSLGTVWLLGGGKETQLVMQKVLTFTSPTTVTFRCEAGSPVTSAFTPSLNAIQVGTVH